MRPINPLPDRKNRHAFGLVQRVVSAYSKIPLVIGITGAGGAGKTTFASNIARHYGPKQCVTLDLDDYLLPRDMRGKLGITGYNPQANKISEAREHIEQLMSGEEITKPVYDHSIGSICGSELISPQSLIIIEGVTTLYPELTDVYTFSIFLDACDETQIKSRIERDVKRRGYTLNEALALYRNLQPDYKKYVAPTRRHASVVFEVTPDYVMRVVYIDRKLDNLLNTKNIEGS